MGKEEFLIYNTLIKRNLTLKINGIEYKTLQIQMKNWPDHLTPEENNQIGSTSLEYVLSIIAEVRANFINSPILTHCR